MPDKLIVTDNATFFPALKTKYGRAISSID